MDLHYGIEQPLRFYESISHQNRFRDGSDSSVFRLYCPKDYLLPFQIKRDIGFSSITSIKLVSLLDGSETEMLSDLASGEVKLFPFSTYDYLVHYGSQAHTLDITPGQYYLSVSDTDNTWYSEVITFLDFDETDLSDCVMTKITYWDISDVGNIFYRTLESDSIQYKNIVYLDVGIGKPEYEFTEEGEESGNGEFVADYRKLEKKYLLQTVIPEFMTDALSMLPLHTSRTGSVHVQTNSGYSSDIDLVSVDIEWQDKMGIWAKVDLLFNTSFITKTNCVSSADSVVDKCIRTTKDFVAEILENSTDYLAYQYTSDVDGVTKVPFVNNDVVLVEMLSGEKQLMDYTDSPDTYSAHVFIGTDGAAGMDSNVKNGNSLSPKPYHFYWSGLDWLQTPVIDSLTEDATTGRQKLIGKSWSDCVIEVWVETPSGDQLVDYGTGSDFISTGVLFDIPEGGTGVYVKCVGLSCELEESATTDFTGIGTMQISTTFQIS